MLGPRAGLSTVLITGAIVLLVAIVIGNSMGNRVIGQIASRGPLVAATPIPSPSVGATDDAASHALWKRRQVLSVATDPAFPDPRVTPEPPPPPPPATPRPTPHETRTPLPTPSAGPDDSTDNPSADPEYTSPPMPLPLVSHGPGETSPPDAEGGSPRPNPSIRPSPSPGVSTVNQ